MPKKLTQEEFIEIFDKPLFSCIQVLPISELKNIPCSVPAIRLFLFTIRQIQVSNKLKVLDVQDFPLSDDISI